MTTKRCTPANDELCEVFMQKAKTWQANTRHFHSAKAVAVCAVAEYLANQQGYTLYGSPSENDDGMV